MTPSPTFLRRLPWIAGGGLVVTLIAGLLVPIYTDEVGWRAQMQRSPFDGGVDRELADQCGPNTDLAAPWFIQPLRHFTAWFDATVADPRAIRILGVALGCLLVGLLAALARAADRTRGSVPLAYAYALLGLGTLPFLLVWHRPEQPILLALVAGMLVALKAPPGPRAAGWCAGAIVLLALYLIGAHPKGVIFSPILMVAALLAGRGRDGLALRIAAAGLILLMAAGSMPYWQTRFACPADAAIAAHNAAENVFAANKGKGIGALLHALFDQARPMMYIYQTRPGADQMSDWLPELSLPFAVTKVWRLAVRVPWLLALAATAIGVAMVAYRCWRQRTIDRPLLLALAAIVCVCGWGALQVNKNVYESALTLPLLAIALMLVAPALWREWPRFTGWAAAALVLVALASETMLLAAYVPPLARTAARPGLAANQPFSFVPWGYPRMRTEILAAGRLCGIEPAHARYLLVDDITYWPFIRSYRPFNRMAIFQDWIPTSRDPLGYLRAHGSSGVVTECAVLPPALRAQAKSIGQFCCIGPL